MFFKLLLRPFVRKRNRYTSQFFNHCFLYGTTSNVSKVSVSQVKQLFKEHRLVVSEGHACIIAECPLCANTKKGPKLYITKDTGHITCEKCRFTGSWAVLEKFLSSIKSKERIKEAETLKESLKVDPHFEDEWSRVKAKSQNISDLAKETYKDVLNEFSFPNISQKDSSSLNCFYNKSLKVLHFPIIDVRNSVIGYKTLSLDKKEETIPANITHGCIVHKPEKKAREKGAILVNSVQRLLALAAEKTNMTILCLVSDTSEVPDELLPLLECYTKLILWLGNDEDSWYISKNLATKLGETRCYCIRAPSEESQLTQGMDHDIKNTLKNVIPVSNTNIVTFDNLRNQVLHDLLNIKKVDGTQWTRFPTLNKILKGHRKGELTVMTGPTGCGKTTFASEYSLDLAMQGVKTLWGSFEIKNTRLAKTMLQQYVGFPLEENIDQFDVSATAFNELPIYFMTFHGQQLIQTVMETIEHSTYVHNINHVIIDNMQFMLGIAEDSKHIDRFWRQDIVVSKFRTFATQTNCHVTLIIHPRKERAEDDLTSSSIFGGAKVTQEADNILIIQDKRLSSPRGKKYLQISKNRYTGDLGIMPLDFEPTALSHAQKKKDKSEESNERPSKRVKSKESTLESLTGMNFDIWASGK